MIGNGSLWWAMVGDDEKYHYNTSYVVSGPLCAVNMRTLFVKK